MHPENIMLSNERRASLAKMKDLVTTPKAVVRVTLTDDQSHAKVPQYTSLDEIKGEVLITASCETTFDHIYITFEGFARTFVDKIAATSPTTGRTEAFHNFLRLVHPLDTSALSGYRIIRAGTCYRFPFTFVVPDTLPPQTCAHDKRPGFPEGGHSTPPPSLGDALVGGYGSSHKDDMAPDMGIVAYSIKGRITSGTSVDGKYKTIAEGSKRLRIVPAIKEQPPLDVIVEGDDRYDFIMRREKNIRKGTFRKRLGRLVVQSAQPPSLRLPYARGPDADCIPTTMATLNVRFDPVDESCPLPGLNTLQVKLKVATCFASVPMNEIPTKSNDFHSSNVRGIFVETVNLSSLRLSNIEWEQQTSSTDLPNRRNSGIPDPSEAYIGGSYYTARVVVPVSLPRGNKVLIPSFHSCLISRMYALDLYLSLSTPGATVTNPTIQLKLPLQVSSEGNTIPRPTISVQEQAAIAAREDDPELEHPAPQYSEQARDAPPPFDVGGGLIHARQRFHSLRFENEGEEMDPLPPPEYARNTRSE